MDYRAARRRATEFRYLDRIRARTRCDIFFVPKPVGFDPTAGDRFAANLYLDGSGGDDDKYRGFRAWRAAGPAEREGYYCRDSDQVE